MMQTSLFSPKEIFMKNLAVAFLALIFMTSVQASDQSQEAPVKHLNVPSVTSLEEAKKIFIEKTLEINSKQTLDEAELQQIHIITYTLEQSVAYFSENFEGEGQQLAKNIAEVVESIHLGSENNRKEATQQKLKEYFQLASLFIYKYWESNKDDHTDCTKNTWKLIEEIDQ